MIVVLFMVGEFKQWLESHRRSSKDAAAGGYGRT